MERKGKLKGIVYWGILAVVILIFHNALIVKAATREEALNWVYAQEGKFLDYDGQYGAQCVDLIKYYYKYFGKASYAKGNGCDYVSNALPDGWIRIKNTADFIPEPGDIAVWGTELSNNGHVAIIISAGINSFVSMDQNCPSGSACKRVTHNYNKFWGIIRPKYTNSSINNPFGSFDSINVDAGKIAVHGWAADMDTPNGAIWVHFYAVKNGAREWLGATLANEYRPDVCKDYPGLGEYHGFNAIFNTKVDGDIQIEAHGINVGSTGENIMLANSPKNASVPKDTVAPTISNVEITDRSASGYTVTCTVEDNVEISKVQFPTWTANNWQDDIIWHEGTISGNKASCRINTSEHNNEVDCEYLTHIYAYDLAGNSVLSPVSVYIDTKGPIISDVEVTDVSEKGYTVICTVEDKVGISKVQFPTWTMNNGQDDIIWYEGTISGNNASCRINVSEHNNEIDCEYYTHIYAWDEFGNASECYKLQVTVKKDHKHEYISSIKKEATCTENGIKLYICKDGDDSYEEEIPATGKHINTEVRNAKIATCTVEGYTGDTYCKDCGTLISAGQKISKKEHSWYKIVIVKQPTCTESGIKEHICAECLGRKSEEIPPTGIHTNTEIRNVKEATCAEDGYTGDTYCKDCGTQISTGQIIEKTAHTWDEGTVTKKATCTENGIKMYTCIACRATRTEEIPSTGHQHTELRYVKEATCAQVGYTGDTYCTDCGMRLVSGTFVPKSAHTWDEGTVTKKATCTETGIRTYTCEICQATKTEIISATGKHENTEVRNVKDPTCSQEGYTGDTYCKDCGTLLFTGKSIPKTAHIWDAGKVTQNATCTQNGIKTFTCTVCESTRTEEVPATGHTNKFTKFAKNASCKSEGYTGDTYCQDCGALLEEGKIISKTAHTWNAGEVTKTASCTAEGVKTFTCTSCGITKTEAIAATGHGTTEIRNEKTASCASEGYTGDLYCTVCGQKISSGSVIAKTVHSWDDGVVTKQPTTAEEGIKTYTCRNCGATQLETLAKLEPQTATPGKTIKDKATNGIYKVLNDGLSVEFTKPISKKASIKIPDTITVNGITCKVTGISSNAFKNNASLKSVTIGANVTAIGTNAFYGCKKLNKVSGGAGIVKIGDKVFANCGSLSSITISATVRSIGKQAFYNCKKLRTIIVKTSALSSKNIGSKAFAGTYQKPTVKVPAKQMKAYKKLLKSKGMNSNAVYKK